MATVYEEIEALKVRMAVVETEVAALTQATADSGWLDLPLTDGIEVYANTQVPQYRKIGDIVFIRGAVKNVMGTGIIGTLPTGYRPAATISFIQNTSLRAGNFPMFARYTINSNGEIKLEAISDGASFGASKWFPVSTVFVI